MSDWPKFSSTPIEDEPRAFYAEDWERYWSSLTQQQKQAIKDKARWEHECLSYVAMHWGGP